MAKKKTEKPASKGEFSVDGEDFKFITGKFKLDGRVVTKEEALANESILRRLVEMKSGLIRQVF